MNKNKLAVEKESAHIKSAWVRIIYIYIYIRGGFTLHGAFENIFIKLLKIYIFKVLCKNIIELLWLLRTKNDRNKISTGIYGVICLVIFILKNI